MIFCSKCGYRMKEGDKFCFNCGTPYSSQPETTGPTDLGRIPALTQEEKNEIKGKAGSIIAPVAPVAQESVATEVFGYQDEEPALEEVTGELCPVKKEETYAVFSYTDGGSNIEYKMTTSLINIGRDSRDCEIAILSDKFIGRNHALIYYKNGRFFAVDLKSKNGTYINGEKLEGLKQINDGDVVRVAITELKFKALV